MTKRLFVDTAHPEEIRVAVADDTKLEKFEFEVTSKTTIRGNIYLAKVIRIEPSLQAAFVDYGCGKHGFLGFSEIHPNYYQIPVSDREELEKLLKEAEEKEAEERAKKAEQAENTEPVEGAEAQDAPTNEDTDDDLDDHKLEHNISKIKHQFYRRYKIQEVIKKRQVMLVQVVKEERGNKGAALTTFISLAGRYCVVMPNTDRPCGISKKITSVEERKQMKQVLSTIDVPQGMCTIIRTSGVNHTRNEIAKDFDYTLQIWEDIRELTLNSQAPCLIHEEANIIKRTIRDLYTKDIDEILVDGEEGFRSVRGYMKKILPTHVKKVKLYDDKEHTMFGKYGLDKQIEVMYSTRVDLPSGGYIVITPTEALVSIDVNSGKMTKERNIGATALKTNLEAAIEVARQCKLRDFGGLIVVDFIDMPEDRNDNLLERTVREAFADDRAKVQISRVSVFGLMEISRQRLHPNLMELHRIACPHCNGTGTVWSTESIVLKVLRRIDEVCAPIEVKEVKVLLALETALFIMNNKREYLANVEKEKDCRIIIGVDHALSPQNFVVHPTKVMKHVRAEVIDDKDAVDDTKTIAEAIGPMKSKFQRRKFNNSNIQNAPEKRKYKEKFKKKFVKRAKNEGTVEDTVQGKLPLGEANPEKHEEKSVLHDAAKYIGLDADKIVPVDKVNSIFKEEHDIAIGNVVGNDQNPPEDRLSLSLGYTEISRSRQPQRDPLILDPSDQPKEEASRSVFFARQKKEWLNKLKKSDK